MNSSSSLTFRRATLAGASFPVNRMPAPAPPEAVTAFLQHSQCPHSGRVAFSERCFRRDSPLTGRTPFPPPICSRVSGPQDITLQTVRARTAFVIIIVIVRPDSSAHPPAEFSGDPWIHLFRACCSITTGGARNIEVAFVAPPPFKTPSPRDRRFGSIPSGTFATLPSPDLEDLPLSDLTSPTCKLLFFYGEKRTTRGEKTVRFFYTFYVPRSALTRSRSRLPPSFTPW